MGLVECAAVVVGGLHGGETYDRPVAQRVLLAILALGGLAIALAWGWGALGVYLFLVGVPFLITLALGIGGEWVAKASRGRFADRDR